MWKPEVTACVNWVCLAVALVYPAVALKCCRRLSGMTTGSPEWASGLRAFVLTGLSVVVVLGAPLSQRWVLAPTLWVLAWPLLGSPWWMRGRPLLSSLSMLAGLACVVVSLVCWLGDPHPRREVARELGGGYFCENQHTTTFITTHTSFYVIRRESWWPRDRVLFERRRITFMGGTCQWKDERKAAIEVSWGDTTNTVPVE